MKSWRFFSLMLSLLLVSSVAAQDANTCSAAVQGAVIAVQDVCASTARNQACYGNVKLDATPRAGVTNFTFAQQGDIVNVVDLDTLHLSSLDLQNNVWGVALMQLQANLPDTLPGQNVTFLLFGDVEIQNDVPVTAEMASVEITTNGNVNIRSGPSTNVNVIGSLAGGETAVANGRNTDSSWLRITVPDSNKLGWVFANLVIPAGDVGALSVVDASSTAVPLQPMQAFRFSTGISGPSCEGAPQDGILIQTPEGAGKISLRANDVDIELGSTGYLQAQPGDHMTVSIIEGQGTVTAQGVSVVVPAGAQVEIPIDDNLSATAPPGDPTPYDELLVAPLPIQALPRAISIAPPISPEALNNTAAGGQSGGFGGALPGLGGDLSAFQGMNLTVFCQVMDQSLGQAGMTRSDYIDLVNQMMGFVPAGQRSSLTQFLDLLKSCP